MSDEQQQEQPEENNTAKTLKEAVQQTASKTNADVETKEETETANTEEKSTKGIPDESQKFQRIIREQQEKIDKLLKAQESNNAQEIENAKKEVENLKSTTANEIKKLVITNAVLKEDCIDDIALLAHINVDDVEMSDDGKTIKSGLDVEKLKEQFPHLFKQTKTVSTTGTQAGGEVKTKVAKTIAEGLRMSKEK